MNMSIRLAAGCLATALACVACTAAFADVALKPREAPPGLSSYTPPVFPDYAKSRGIAKGTALIAVSWDEEGRAADVVVLNTSYPSFGEAAVEAASQWRRPGGKRGVQTYSLNFELGGVIVITSKMMTDYAAEVRAERPPRAAYPEELDAEPKALAQPMPSVPGEVMARYQAGRVVVEYFIDEDGRVRAPSIIHSTSDEFTQAALAAMAQWRYEKPRRGGLAVVTTMRYAFDFKMRN
jgi:TonB family protein